MNTRQRVIAFLGPALVRAGFRGLGPHSWLFENERDKLLIYVAAANIVIVHDGPNVVDGIVMIQLLPDLEESALDGCYLQPILHRF